MEQFLVTVRIPYLGQHGWTSWGERIVLLVQEESMEDVLILLSSILPEKDPKIQEALVKQDHFNLGQYFEGYIVELEKGRLNDISFCLNNCSGSWSSAGNPWRKFLF